MTGPLDLSDHELEWLSKAEKVRVVLPGDMETRFVRLGLINRTSSGQKITGLGRMVLDEARKTARPAAAEQQAETVPAASPASPRRTARR